MQNLVAVSHSVCAYEGSLKNLGDARPHPLGRRAWRFPGNTRFSSITMPDDCTRSNHASVIAEIRLKNLTSPVPPFKVTLGHWNRHGSIGYLWLPISDP